jgi:hypothetical protein
MEELTLVYTSFKITVVMKNARRKWDGDTAKHRKINS